MSNTEGEIRLSTNQYGLAIAKKPITNPWMETNAIKNQVDFVNFEVFLTLKASKIAFNSSSVIEVVAISFSNFPLDTIVLSTIQLSLKQSLYKEKLPNLN